MIVNFFDVEHGNCALIKTPNGKHILVDCGHNSTTGFTPSSYLRQNGIFSLDHLIITNVDQDHISDIRNIYKPLVLTRNKSVDQSLLNRVKEEITPEMEHYIELHENYNSPANPDYGTLTTKTFCHDTTKFDDTNNLSIVTFVNDGNITIVFPGDLEIAGWKEHMLNPSFVEELKKVNVFVASHHGRESGYYPEIFDHFTPEIIIISDESIQYDTQRDIGYANHASGVMIGGQKKYVLTTRNHGMITLAGNQLSFVNQ